MFQLLEIISKRHTYAILRPYSYAVSFDWHNNLGILRYSILVKSQETKSTADYVDVRIEDSRHKLLSILEQMTEEDFDIFKMSLVKKKWIECDKSVVNYKAAAVAILSHSLGCGKST